MLAIFKTPSLSITAILHVPTARPPQAKCLILATTLAPIRRSRLGIALRADAYARLAAQSTPPGRTGRPFTARYVHPQWPKTAILAEIRGNNRGKRLVDGRESLSRRPQPPGCTTRPQKTGSRDSTIISLALHTVEEFLTVHKSGLAAEAGSHRVGPQPVVVANNNYGGLPPPPPPLPPPSSQYPPPTAPVPPRAAQITVRPPSLPLSLSLSSPV